MLLVANGALRAPDLHLDRTTRRALTDLVEQGAVIRRSAAIHLPGADPELIRCHEDGVLLTCEAGARVYGLPWYGPGGPAHVAMDNRRGRPVRTQRGEVHREKGLTLPGPLDPPVVEPPILAARVLRCASEVQAIVVVDAILNRGLASREEIAARLRGNRHGAPEARRRLARTSEKARSMIETVARLELEDAGHSVRPGVVVEGVGEVDLIVDDRLCVETDGYAYHSAPGPWTKDRHRDQALLGRGTPTVRLTYDDVMSSRAVPVVEQALLGLGRLSTRAPQNARGDARRCITAGQTVGNREGARLPAL